MQIFLRKQQLLLSILFFVLGLAQGQTAQLKGSITDSVSGETLPAIITLPQLKQVVYCNALGQYQLQQLPQGTYTCRISCVGFAAQSFKVELKESETSVLNATLSPAVIRLSEVSAEAKTGENLNVISSIDKQLRPANSAQDLLRLVPGLFIAQHAGGGKAEQIFLRGFDCDHGTDFFVSVDGMPVNMVSHAHGQGYADFHFVIPETIDKLKVYKGPYAAKHGDFTTSGAGEFSTKNTLQKSQVKLECGQFDTYRAMLMLDLLRGKHLFTKKQESAYMAAEYNFTNAYFKSPQKFKRFNIFGKYNALLNDKNFISFSLSTFRSSWNASGQIPQRAVNENVITRFGSIDNSEGGATDRTNANLSLTTSFNNGAIMKNQVYYCNYHFNLFSNFTFFLHDSVNGDEINQTEKGRNVYGYTGSFEKNSNPGNKKLKSIAGIGTRIDVGEIALRHAVKRVVLDTFVVGKLFEQTINAYLDETLELSSKLSINVGLRADYFSFGFQNYVNDSLTGTKTKAKLSPKLNVYYNPNSKVQLYAHAGTGFHSNDARAVVLGLAQNSLPRAIGYEAGSTFSPFKKVLVNAAIWGLDLENELVYVGDENIVEIKGATRRLGADFSLRYELSEHFYLDADLNYSHGRFTDLPKGQNFIPLAPTLTSTGGISMKRERGFNVALRYRCTNTRPATEDNSVQAKGYFILDAVLNYVQPKFQFGLSAENVLNANWNQAQFATRSRLKNETQAVTELHYTPGTPFFLKGSFSYFF